MESDSARNSSSQQKLGNKKICIPLITTLQFRHGCLHNIVEKLRFYNFNIPVMGSLFAESTKEKNKPSSHEKKKVELSESDGHKDNPWICPFKIWEKNCAFPVLADALEITYDDDVGRHVKAKRNIMAGKTLRILHLPNEK